MEEESQCGSSLETTNHDRARRRRKRKKVRGSCRLNSLTEIYKLETKRNKTCYMLQTLQTQNPLDHQSCYHQQRRLPLLPPPLTMATTTTNIGAPDAVEDGCCPTCGVRLFEIKTKTKKQGSFLSLGGRLSKSPHWKQQQQQQQQQQQFLSYASSPITTTTVATPLTIEGVVQEGHCLACNTNLDLEELGQQGGQTLYLGEYNLYGARHGPGELIWGNGDRFVGSFFHGNRDGPGTLWFGDGTWSGLLRMLLSRLLVASYMTVVSCANATRCLVIFLKLGSKYAGNWDCNHMHGLGTRHFPNGDVYNGNYKDGVRSGFGKLYFSNGDLYSGFWQNDQMHDSDAKYCHATNKKYFQGPFSNGKRNGKGKLQHADGSIDIFRYEQDCKVGAGVRWSANRKKVWILRPSESKNPKRISIAEAVSIGYDCDLSQDVRIAQGAAPGLLDEASTSTPIVQAMMVTTLTRESSNEVVCQSALC
jgi:hypothetical protein